MKTLLNLLPEEKKIALQREMNIRFVLWQAFLLLLLGCFYLAILFGIHFILDFQLKSYEAIGTAAENDGRRQENTLNEIQKKFKETNETVDTIEAIDRFHLQFTDVFLSLNDLLPQGVRLSRVTTKDYSVMLMGTADERDDLLEFENNLKGSDCVKSVNVPISNLFSKTKVEFQMDFSVDPSCMKNN